MSSLLTQSDMVALFGVSAAVLLVLALFAGVIAALKTFQVRQFQDLLFKAERKIDSLERRMFNVLNAVPVALVETDTTGKFTFANKAAHQLLGRRDSELIGLRFHAATWGITYPDGRQVPPDLMPISRTLRGQTVKGFQHMLTNHSGHQKVLVSVTSMPIMNSMGEVIGATAALVEIENETGEGVDDLTGLWRGHWFAAATVPFWGLDASGQILDINNAALDAFELKREQVLGMNWAQVFVQDEDFQTAIDYLGDTQDSPQDPGDPDRRTSARLRLKTGEGEVRPAVVTAWVVRTHEGGDNGLTVMAMSLTGQEELAVEAAPQMAPAALSDDDAQELADFRAAENALAELGVGTWQYDPVADTIVEDAGMQALIGRETPGGPTLISDDDQTRADNAFRSLMSGAIDAMAMDIRIIGKDGGERWITLKGQAATAPDGVRDIFGVAFDCTEWKTAPAAEAVAGPVAAPQIDLDAVRREAEDALRGQHESEMAALRERHETALSEAAARHAEALAAVREGAPVAEAAEPVVIHEADPQVVAENAELKAQLAAAGDRYDDLAQRYHTLAEMPDTEPQVASQDTSVHDARVAELESRLAEAETGRAEIMAKLDAALNAPAPEPDFSTHEARIDALQARLDQAGDRYDDLAQRYHVLADMPDEAPDTSVYDARIVELESRLAQAETERADTRARLDAALNAPPPEPDYTAHEARIEAAEADLDDARAQRDGWKARYEALAAAPPPDTSGLESDLAAARFDLAKWQAAHRDLQTRLEQIAAQPAVDHHALEVRIDELQGALNQARDQQLRMQAQLEQVTAAHSHAQRYETVGRLTGDVAQDFAQMLGVINNALDMMARGHDTPDNIRRLAEAALAAGKRGERLTRQLQAFQSEDF